MRLGTCIIGIALGVVLSAALAGCGDSQEASPPTGSTNAPGTSYPAPTPGASTPAPVTTGPDAGTAPSDAGLPTITEKPAEPTPTPKEATDKGGTEKGEVKKEQPPKGS